MNNKNRDILICYVFDEFKDIVNVIEEQFRFRSLKNYGYKIRQLNDDCSRKGTPIEESIKAVNSAHYVIALIGNTLGGTPLNKTETYLQLEIKEALKSNKKNLHIWVVGEQYWDGPMGEDVQCEISQFLKDINTTMGKIETTDPQYVAPCILSGLEEEIFRENEGSHDMAQLKDGLLEISGFNQNFSDKLGKEISEQLNIIYSKDKSQFSTKNLEELQSLALENMQFKNLDGALKALHRLTDYFDSDIIGNFWTSRLLAFHKDDFFDSDLNKAIQCSEKTLSALDGAKIYAPMLKAFCYSNIAKSWQKNKNYKKSSEYVNRSRSEYKILDTLVIQVQNILYQNSNKEIGLNDKYISKCSKILRDIYCIQVQYYFKLESDLNSKFNSDFKNIKTKLFQLNLTVVSKINENNHRLTKESSLYLKENAKMSIDISNTISIWELHEKANELCYEQYLNLTVFCKSINLELQTSENLINKHKENTTELEKNIALFQQGKNEVAIIEDINNSLIKKIKYYNKIILSFKFIRYSSTIAILTLVYLNFQEVKWLNMTENLKSISSKESIIIFILLLSLIFIFLNLQYKVFDNIKKKYIVIQSKIKSITIQDLKHLVKDKLSAIKWKDDLENKINQQKHEVSTLEIHLKEKASLIALQLKCFCWHCNQYERFTVSADNRQYTRDLRRSQSNILIAKNDFNAENYIPNTKNYINLMSCWGDPNKLEMLNKKLNSLKAPTWQILGKNKVKKWDVFSI